MPARYEVCHGRWEGQVQGELVRRLCIFYEWRGLWQTREQTACLQGAVENQLQSLLCRNARQSHQISCGYRKLAYFIKNCKEISPVQFFKTFSQNMVCALRYKSCPSIQFNLIMLLLTIIGILFTSMQNIAIPHQQWLFQEGHLTWEVSSLFVRMVGWGGCDAIRIDSMIEVVCNNTNVFLTSIINPLRRQQTCSRLSSLWAQAHRLASLQNISEHEEQRKRNTPCVLSFLLGIDTQYLESQYLC